MITMRARLAIAAATVLLAASPHVQAAESLAVDAMPIGITLQYLGAPQGYGMQRISLFPRSEITYSSEKRPDALHLR